MGYSLLPAAPQTYLVARAVDQAAAHDGVPAPAVGPTGGAAGEGVIAGQAEEVGVQGGAGRAAGVAVVPEPQSVAHLRKGGRAQPTPATQEALSMLKAQRELMEEQQAGEGRPGL